MPRARTPEAAAGQRSPGQPRAPRRDLVYVVGCGLLATTLMAGLLASLHAELLKPWLLEFDLRVMNQIHSWASPTLTRVMFALTFAGSEPTLVTAVGIGLVWLLWRRHIREALGLLCAVGGAAGLDVAFKTWFHRERPTVAWALAHEKSFSFPSGHAMVSIVFYGMLAYLLCRRLPRPYRWIASAGAGLLIFGIGTSRVYLGVHYPSDIVAGYLAGGTWLCSTIVATEILHRSAAAT